MTDGRPRRNRAASRRTDQSTDHAADQPTDDPDTTMTTTDRHDEPRSDTQTLADVSHTHPDTGRTFGGNFTFARGGAIAADGGKPDVVPEDDDPETLADVSHTPPNDSEDANRVFERGDEHEDGEEAEAEEEDEAAAGEDDEAPDGTDVHREDGVADE